VQSRILVRPPLGGDAHLAGRLVNMKVTAPTTVLGGTAGDDELTGRVYGLLQLSDKSGGRDFDADDEEHVREPAAFVGETLDALRAASPRS
jgi:hypothetical protein